MPAAPPRTAASTRPAWRKALRRALLVLVATWLGYLVLGNLFLNTPLGPWAINRKPERVQVHWQAGLTVLPGGVRLWGMHVKGHTGNLRWDVGADNARGRIALLPLLKKEVSFPWVRVEGVEATMDRTTDRMPPTPARPGGWLMRFDSISSDSVRGGRYGNLQLQGSGHAEVGFSKQMRGGPMELKASTVRFEHGRLSQDDDLLLDLDALGARFSMDRHTREQASGVQKLLKTVAELDFEGRTAALQVQEAGVGQVRLAPVPGRQMGRARGKIGWQRGGLVAGSMLDWTSPVSVSGVGDGTGDGAELEIGMQVDDDIHLHARLPQLVAPSGGALAVDADLVLAGNRIPFEGTPSENLAALSPRSSGHLVGTWQFDSLRWVGRYFADFEWLALEGAGRIDADMKLTDGRPVAGSRITVPRIDVTADVMGNRIQGSARAEGVLQAGAGNGIRPRLDLHMDRFSIAAAGSSADAGGDRYVEGRDLQLEVEAMGDLDRSMIGQEDGVARVREALRARLRFSDARVPDLRVYNRYLPRTQLRFDGGNGLLSGDLSVDGAGGIGQGWLRVRGRDTRLHVAGVDLRGNVDINTRLDRADIEKGRFNIDGSQLRLDDISLVEPGGETRSGWWARVELDRARLDWTLPGEAGGKAKGGAEVDVSGHARITMKDVSLLLALYSHRRAYPKWIPRLVDAGQAQVTGEVQWRDDILVLDKLVANNDRFDVNARLRLQGQQRRGSLYARWGVLSMAVDLDNGRHDFHLVRARHWYDSQPPLLR